MLKVMITVLAFSAVSAVGLAEIANVNELQPRLRAWCTYHGVVLNCTSPRAAAAAAVSHNNGFHSQPGDHNSARLQRCS